MEISVICTVYNEGEQVRRLLDSLLEQSQLPDEIVIVDGGSTDRTQEILRHYEEKYDRIRVIIQEGANIAEGRNIAVENTHNEVILGIDGGCVADEDWVKGMMDKFEAGADAVAGMFAPLSRNLFEFVQGEIVTSSYDEEAIEAGERAPSSRSIGFKKNVWREVGGYPEDLYTGEDTKFNSKVQEEGYSFEPAPGAIVYWNMRPTLRSFANQFYRYGQGDARASNLGNHPSKIEGIPKNLLLLSLGWGIFSAVVLSLFLSQALLFAGAIVLIPYLYHYRSLARSVRKKGPKTMPLWALLVTTKFSAYFVGFHQEILK